MEEKKLAIIATKGSLDWAYPPFILSSTAAALGYETEIFFTFYGLQLLKKDLNLQVSPLGNPGMPMPMPVPVVPCPPAYSRFVENRRGPQAGTDDKSRTAPIINDVGHRAHQVIAGIDGQARPSPVYSALIRKMAVTPA